MPDSPNLPVPARSSQLTRLDQMAAIPEEEVWLAKQKSRQTHRAHQFDLRHFMRALDITNTEALRQVDHRAVIAWERMRREQEGMAPSTVRRRFAALSSLFKHLVTHGAARRDPVVGVDRPAINRDEGTTAAFSKARARKLLDTPPADRLAGARDRAILAVGLQVGFRKAEIAALPVGDLHQNREFDALRVTRKGGRRESLAINPQAAQRSRAYLESVGHGAQHDVPLSRSLRGNKKPLDPSGRMDPGAIDRVVRKDAATIELDRGYSAHSMRATFITTVLANGAQLEDAQKTAGHRNPSTSKLYDRRHYYPEKAARFLTTYQSDLKAGYRHADCRRTAQ